MYDNGYRVDSASEVAGALEQCKSSGVSCAATAVGTPSQVTKWYDVENAGTGTGLIEACGAGEGEINQTIGGSHTFTWGWNIGINADVTLVKDVLKVGAPHFTTSVPTRNPPLRGISVSQPGDFRAAEPAALDRHVGDAAFHVMAHLQHPLLSLFDGDPYVTALGVGVRLVVLRTLMNGR
ncbi:hypothetical protein ABZW18_19470 [Streptomyces sp. NPDC004647]|uniref:hypothetical protein n=1 Tax=Streptomyces sp. NPDC004647 TaxID=3154671 RepID=UPI0033BB4C63